MMCQCRRKWTVLISDADSEEPVNVGRQGRTGNLWTLHCKSLNCPTEIKSDTVSLDRVPGELWMEVHNIVQEAVIKTICKKKKVKMVV